MFTAMPPGNDLGPPLAPVAFDLPRWSYAHDARRRRFRRGGSSARLVRAYLKSAVAGALLLGMATAAMAVTGEFGNRCTMGLALDKEIKTDCSRSVS